MRYFSVVAIVIFTILTACSNSTDPNYDDDYNTIKSLSIRNAIAIANEWKHSKPKITSFITPKELKIIFPDERKVILSLPEDEMYVAIAPYIDNTHTCSTHYLSSCQGEMYDENFELTISDENNHTFFEGFVKTGMNGFFELWLPRGQEFSFNLQFREMKSVFILGSFDNSNTCVTNVRLE